MRIDPKVCGQAGCRLLATQCVERVEVMSMAWMAVSGNAGAAAIALASSPAATTAATTRVGGQAVFENATLRIAVGADLWLSVQNKLTAEHIAIGLHEGRLGFDGQGPLTFWGTTSLVFEDGTKLTLQTAPPACRGGGSAMLTLVDGDYGVRIGAVADADGVPRVVIDERAHDGAALDAAVADGNLLLDNARGAGFVAPDGNGVLRAVDQAHLDATDLVQLRRLEQLLQRILRLIGSLMRISLLGSLTQMAPTQWSPKHDDAPPPAPRQRRVAAMVLADVPGCSALSGAPVTQSRLVLRMVVVRC